MAGAHPDGGIGIRMAKPTHLIPNVMRAALGAQALTVFGDDYPTRDGTAIRDYVHVVDLCEAHWLAVKALKAGTVRNKAINLGNGRGFSIKEVIRAVEKTLGRTLPVKVVGRRAGDVMTVVASNALARKLLGWSPKYSLADIIRTAYDWEKAEGY